MLVIGCSQPSERPATSPQLRRDDAADSDTRSGDLADETARAPSECVPRFGHTCNPPPPADARQLVVREGEVLNVDKRSDGLYFDVSLGAGALVEWSWIAEFIDDTGKPIEGTRFKIKERGGSMIVGFLANRGDLPSKRVRVSEPGEQR